MHPALVAAAAAASTQLDTVTISALISLFMPLAVSFITKRESTDGLKALTNIVATALLAAVVIVLVPPDGTQFSWTLVANTFVASLLTSFMAYKGIWKPTGVTASIAEKSAGFGLGSPPTVETQAGLVENNETQVGPNDGYDWSSIPSVDGEPQRLDREPDMVPDESFHPELTKTEADLTEIGEGPEGQLYRQNQQGD